VDGSQLLYGATMDDKNTQYQVTDKSKDRSYFTIIPNLIEDFSHITPYEFRLYVHLKRVAGDEGRCWQSTKTLATACGMSVGSVVKARKGLYGLGLIDISVSENKHGGNDYFEVEIVDVWEKNFAARSLHELASSPGEPINISINNNPIVKTPLPPKAIIPFEIAHFSSPKFTETWVTWEEYRRQLKKPLTMIGKQRQLLKLWNYSAETAIAMLEQSMENGWQGIFELKGNGAAPPPKPRLEGLEAEIDACQEDLKYNPGKPSGEYARKRLIELGVIKE
jgi:hypothetical protein